jgi:hypothetical protein
MAALALVLSVFWAISYVLSIHHRRQAEQMLQQLSALQPGATDFHTVQRIAKGSGGREYCTDELCRYDFDNDLWPRRVFGWQRWRTEWDYFGLRPWQVSVYILKRTSGLTDMWVLAFVGRGRGWLENEGFFSGSSWASWEVSIRTSAVEFDHAFGREKEEVLSYGRRTADQIEATSNGIVVDTPPQKRGEVLLVYLSPKASSNIRSAAFDLNLRCATTISPCTQLCQIAPSAWHSYVQFYESNGLTVGQTTDCAAGNHR